jgi:hypothetical protein
MLVAPKGPEEFQPTGHWSGYPVWTCPHPVCRFEYTGHDGANQMSDHFRTHVLRGPQELSDSSALLSLRTMPSEAAQPDGRVEITGAAKRVRRIGSQGPAQE